MRKPAHISVVVCTYNRASLLREALQSLIALECDGRFSYDIVVIDNASTDETPSVINELARASEVPISNIREDRPGIAYARNRGVAEATGEWIAFFDDDGIADPKWLAALLSTAFEKDARCVGGSIQIVVPETERRYVSPELERILSPAGRGSKVNRYGPKEAPPTCNLIVHRSVFEQIGTFDETMNRWSGEDTELFDRMHSAGIEAWYAPDARIEHVTPAYRLSPGYLEWISLRKGWAKAQLTRIQSGPSGVASMALLRLVKVTAVSLPAFCAESFRSSHDHRLYRRCQFWFLEGFIRSTLNILAPQIFEQRTFNQRIEMRAERDLF